MPSELNAVRITSLVDENFPTAADAANSDILTAPQLKTCAHLDQEMEPSRESERRA